MSDTNLHILNGRLCDAPKYRLLNSGQYSVNFRIATTTTYKDKAGEWKKRDEFHNVSTYITQANHPFWLARALKGKRMQVIGERRTEKVVNPDGSLSYFSFTAAKQTECTLPEITNQDVEKKAPSREPAPLYLNTPQGAPPVSSDNDLSFEDFCDFNHS